MIMLESLDLLKGRKGRSSAQNVNKEYNKNINKNKVSRI
jgi:hypothetical protein